MQKSIYLKLLESEQQRADCGERSKLETRKQSEFPILMLYDFLSEDRLKSPLCKLAQMHKENQLSFWSEESQSGQNTNSEVKVMGYSEKKTKSEKGRPISVCEVCPNISLTIETYMHRVDS